MNYFFHILIYAEIYVILSLSLNIILGYGGILSLTHAAFYGLGAYLTTFFVLSGIDFIPAILLAGALTSVSSVIISAASSRFKGDIFVLVTLAFQIVFFSIVYNWVQVTKGNYGIPGIPRPSFFGTDQFNIVLLYTLITAFVIFVIQRISKSAFSLSLMSLRDNEIAAISLGKNNLRLKSKGFIVSSFFAALAGGMYACYITYIDPTSFSVDESILLLSMVIIGGSGNVIGPITGAVLLIVLPEVLRFLNIPDDIAPNIRLIIYGIILVILMFYRPRGLAGKYRFE